MTFLQGEWPEAVRRWIDKDDREILTVADSHTGGNPTRIVLSGIQLPPEAATVDAARAWLRTNADWIRTRLVHEPRGGGLTCAVIPILGREDDCDIGAVILEPGSYPPMCGHCMIGFASVIVELDLIPGLWRENDKTTAFKIRTPAGAVGVTARRGTPNEPVDVTLTNVPSYVVARGECAVPSGTVPTDLLYGGDYYITVDADYVGLSLDRNNATEIVTLARELKDAYTAGGVTDPLTGEALDVYQVMFFRRLTGGASPRAKIVVVAPPGVIDRSPCGTGSSALYANLRALGELTPAQTLTTESIIGSTFTIRSERSLDVRGRLEVTPLLTGTAFINGFLSVAVDRRDGLRDGFPPL